MTPEATIHLAGSLRRATDALGDRLLAMPATELRSQLLEAFMEVDSVSASLEFQAWATRTQRLVTAVDEGLPIPEAQTIEDALDKAESIAKSKVGPPARQRPRGTPSDRYVAKDMTCPTCGAKPGEPCIKVSMRGSTMSSGVKGPIGTPQKVAHDKRIQAAKQMNELLGAPA